MIPPNERAWIENTHGLVQHEEGEYLAQLAAKVPANQAIVEIGSHTGLSTLWLAAGSATGARSHVVCVDPWADPRSPGPGYNDDPFDLKTGNAVLERFLRNIAGTTQEVPNTDYGELVTPLRATSMQVAGAWVKPIGLLFIDAIHTFEAVKADYLAWSPHVAPGGWIALNDYWTDTERTRMGGPAFVVHEIIERSGLWDVGEVIWNTWVARRK